MCGIAGILAAGRNADSTAALERLTGALHHRGPDGSGFRYFNGRTAGFGHRRLSIVDLETGAQPISNEDGTVWITYNGEIYNHRAIRRELEQRGHRFRTQSDTEVVVHGWEEWGPAVLERLNGIFALALFDGRAGSGVVWLARDPVGVKPLYVGRSERDWWFASELSAAREADLVEPDYRPEAFDEFLVYRFVPSPGTFFRHAWKVPPGHFCQLEPGNLPDEPLFQRYQPRFAPSALPTSKGEWEEVVRSGLEAAVSRQLMSDVPVGSLLSGGVDSTIVTGVMRDELPSPPQCFAVGVSDGGETNELPIARKAARALGVPLTEVAVGENEFLAAWPGQISRMSEPVANSGVLLVGILCQTVGRTHKVVLSGQGADEPLGGYPRHAGERWYPWARRLRPLLDLVPERWAASDRVERMRRLAHHSDPARRFAEILSVFSPAEVGQVTGHAVDMDRLAEPVRRWLPEGDGHDSLNSLLVVDARLSLADDLLLVADHMAMASSVELRVPFLDLELLALLEAMPSKYKISPLGERKWLYRRAVTDLVPPVLRESLTGFRGRTGTKLGFTSPIASWLSQWARRAAQPYLTGAGARLPAYVRPEAIKGIIGESASGRPRSRQLLSLYVLETWLRGAEASVPAGVV